MIGQVNSFIGRPSVGQCAGGGEDQERSVCFTIASPSQPRLLKLPEGAWIWDGDTCELETEFHVEQNFISFAVMKEPIFLVI